MQCWNQSQPRCWNCGQSMTDAGCVVMKRELQVRVQNKLTYAGAVRVANQQGEAEPVEKNEKQLDRQAEQIREGKVWMDTRLLIDRWAKMSEVW